MPVMRSVKNIVKNYTDAEVKVREATSNDPWGPSSTLMSEIADLTYNVVAFNEIMSMIWKRLNDHGKNWRHVYKSLTLLEYILKTGSEKVSTQCKENLFVIKTLKDFQHMEENKDLGTNVREKAKALVALLADDERLKNERAKALKAKERFTENFGIGSDSTHIQLGRSKHRPAREDATGSSSNKQNLAPDMAQALPSSVNEEQMQLELALAMSRETAETEAKQKNNDDVKLQMALEESKKSEVVREQTQPSSLLDMGAVGGSVPSNDPWSTSQPPVSVTTAPPPSNNPWSPQPTASEASPWAANTAVPVAQPQTHSDLGFLDTPAPAVAKPTWESDSDPWNAQPVATGPSNDPWGASAKNGTNGQTGSIDDEFAGLSARPLDSNPSTVPANSFAGMSLMDPILDNRSQSPSLNKKPEDFLEPHAKNLVNLDSLITKPAAPATSSVTSNPFAMTAVGQSQPVVVNPFTANQPIRPSLNQMSQASVPGFQNPQPVLPNPMMPAGGNMGYNAHMGMSAGIPQQQFAQQPQANLNPFL